jgi:hypothetical protein
MAQCAWCRRPDPMQPSFAYFAGSSTHSICLGCAVQQLVHRSRTLHTFLITHREELVDLPAPSGYAIADHCVYRLFSYPQLLVLLERTL